MTPQEMLEQLIDEAWQDFNTIATEEEEDDYSNAMVSMERTHAEGFAEGLQLAYKIAFDKDYNPPIIEEAGLARLMSETPLQLVSDEDGAPIARASLTGFIAAMEDEDEEDYSRFAKL